MKRGISLVFPGFFNACPPFWRKFCLPILPCTLHQRKERSKTPSNPTSQAEVMKTRLYQIIPASPPCIAQEKGNSISGFQVTAAFKLHCGSASSAPEVTCWLIKVTAQVGLKRIALDTPNIKTFLHCAITWLFEGGIQPKAAMLM